MKSKENKPQETVNAKNTKKDQINNFRARFDSKMRAALHKQMTSLYEQGKSSGLVNAYIDNHSMEDKHDEQLNQSTSLDKSIFNYQKKSS